MCFTATIIPQSRSIPQHLGHSEMQNFASFEYVGGFTVNTTLKTFL